MTTSIRPVRRLAHFLLPLMAAASFSAQADSHEPPQTGVLESFLCTYNDGEDRGDLDSATSFYASQAKKAGIEQPQAFLWTLIKGGAPYDIAWLNLHDSLAAYAATADAEAASSEMAAVNERYDSVATCQSNLGNATTVFERETDVSGGAVINVFTCNFRAGAGPSSLQDLHGHIASVNGGMGDAAPNGVYQVTPITSGPTSPDVVMFSVSSNMAHWASTMDYLASEPAGQAVGRHFTSVFDCDASLWAGEQVVGGDG